MPAPFQLSDIDRLIFIGEDGKPHDAALYHCIVLTTSGGEPLGIFTTQQMAEQFVTLMDVRKNYPNIRTVRVPFWSDYWMRQLRDGALVARSQVTG